jgi:hypothetical protein
MLEGEEREVVDVVTKVRDRMVAATETHRANQQRRFDRHRIYILKILKKFGADTISIDGTFELNQYDFQLITLLVTDTVRRIFPITHQQ